MLTNTDLPNLVHRGKVRDTYRLTSDMLLMVATDRVSAFDIVIPSGIPQKGVLLSRMSAFWFEHTSNISTNHFVGLADDLEVADNLECSEYLQQLPEEILSRSTIVREAERVDVECIVRGYIAGSAWSEYRKKGTVLGITMPTGLVEGQILDEPIFTPTTKAEEGHDENMTEQQVEDLVGHETASELKEKSLAVYKYGSSYAAEKGIILADTKMEFGFIDGKLSLIDELLTPDSSRFWDVQGYIPGKSQPNFDKQFIRDWLIETDWDRQPPAPALPSHIISQTADRYAEAYRRLTGSSYQEYHSNG